jgi:hypothetical protein
LQACCEVWRLTNHCLLLGSAFSDPIAHNYGARGDANTNLQRRIGISLELSDGVDQCEPSAHRLLGIVLMRPGIAEIGKHAISHVSSDNALVLSDYFGEAGKIARDYSAHVLGVQACRQGGRADQIAEHDRHVPSLGLILPRWLFDCLGCAICGVIQPSNRAQDFATVPEQHTKFRKVLLREITDDGKVNGVLGEAIGILSQPERHQPL